MSGPGINPTTSTKDTLTSFQLAVWTISSLINAYVFHISLALILKGEGRVLGVRTPPPGKSQSYRFT